MSDLSVMKEVVYFSSPSFLMYSIYIYTLYVRLYIVFWLGRADAQKWQKAEVLVSILWPGGGCQHHGIVASSFFFFSFSFFFFLCWWWRSRVVCVHIYIYTSWNELQFPSMISCIYLSELFFSLHFFSFVFILFIFFPPWLGATELKEDVTVGGRDRRSPRESSRCDCDHSKPNV